MSSFSSEKSDLPRYFPFAGRFKAIQEERAHSYSFLM